MVRAKNVLGMLMQNFFCMGLVSVLWAAVAYSLAFSGTGKYIGNLDLAWMHDVATTSPTGFTLSIPPLSFSAFQLMFAIITPALITGAIADRMKFSAWFWFLGLWLIIVYTPVAHWVFSPEGWLFKRGALDFAGGTVVHINAGIAALAAVLVIGRRRGWPQHPMPPHSLPFTLLGTGILWFGWFGFNAGSALAADGIAAQAFVNTNMAAAAAMLSWLLVERIKGGHATTLGAASGRGRRPRRDHAVRRLRRRHGADLHRAGRGRALLLRVQHQVQVRLRRRARRGRRAPRRRDRGLADGRAVRRRGVQLRGHRQRVSSTAADGP